MKKIIRPRQTGKSSELIRIAEETNAYIIVAARGRAVQFKEVTIDAIAMTEQESEEKMTYGDIYNEFCKKFPNVEVEDYRPAVEMFIPQLSRSIPKAIIVWLKDGSEVIYIAESEEV